VRSARLVVGSGKPDASPPDVRCGPSMGLRSLEVLLALAFQASLAEPRRGIRIGLPLAKREGRIPGESGRRHAFAASTDEAEGTAGA